MIEEYKFDIKEDFQYGDRVFEGKYIFLFMNDEGENEEEKNLDPKRLLYREKDEKQGIGGKNMRGNVNPLPGLYKDLDGRKHYIKIPNDPKEMFCEMFHGALANQLKLHDYLNVDQPYISGAQGIVVKVGESKTLALSVSILPDFKELFEYLGTAKSNGKERDNVKEITNRGIYSKFVEGKLTEKPRYKEAMKESLARCIFQSIVFFGDYSFHSSNVALYGGGMVAKIDGGAAFRSFAKNSPANILFPHEYTGMGFHNTIHKNYIDYYTRIPGLKEYLPFIALDYINIIKSRPEGEMSNIVLKSIQTVRETYAKSGGKNPFTNKIFSEYFGMDLSIDETLLAKQFEGIIYRNIEGFQRIKINKKYKLENFKTIEAIRSTHSIQFTILQIILSRGEDVKSINGKTSLKGMIKNSFMSNFRSNNKIEDIDFLLYLHLLCAPSRSISFSSKTANTLASGLSRLDRNDPVRVYPGISPGNQKVSSSDLTKFIKRKYEAELAKLAKTEGMYSEYLKRVHGNTKVW